MWFLRRGSLGFTGLGMNAAFRYLGTLMLGTRSTKTMIRLYLITMHPKASKRVPEIAA